MVVLPLWSASLRVRPMSQSRPSPWCVTGSNVSTRLAQSVSVRTRDSRVPGWYTTFGTWRAFVYTHKPQIIRIYLLLCFDIGILISLFPHLLYYFRQHNIIVLFCDFIFAFLYQFLCIFVSEKTALLYLHICIALLYYYVLFQPRIIWALYRKPHICIIVLLFLFKQYHIQLHYCITFLRQLHVVSYLHDTLSILWNIRHLELIWFHLFGHRWPTAVWRRGVGLT